jgi:hypothetical protein
MTTTVVTAPEKEMAAQMVEILLMMVAPAETMAVLVVVMKLVVMKVG